ncbi:TctA family transporter [Comamonas sp. BIGb0124]|uniref:tripartite tricarboxylate transporter permease n=1 Tax=Comamonas sp. BIGb0124 TaxID=2485130 RepID=UPI000F497F1B|nr:tripartite tricarboxylate transporter permease [Comamonas sp. BIGb0124]ROR24581.1 TctA family transporter [Comamonas sp. BIGb0124]
MELFDNLALGFSVALSWSNLLYCFAGALLGTIVGVLPGVGPVVTIALLLPLTFGLPAVSAIIMLAGIYYGAQYGGSTTAILMKLPGEPSSVVTAIDGHALARQGKAGTALGIAAIGSFVAGTLAAAFMAVSSPALARFALEFGPADNFALMAFGLVGAVVLARGNPLKAIAMVMVGLILGFVGTDVSSNAERLTFGLSSLADGLGFVVLSMGLVGVSEIIANLERPPAEQGPQKQIGQVWPDRQAFEAAWRPILRGTAVGSILGVLPGAGAALASFTAYSLEKKLAHRPERFGQGAIEGVAGPESANNAAAQTSFVPLLTLGLPSGATTALLLGALTIQGIIPGPQIMTQMPDLFWGVIASMWIGNAILLVLNLPLIGLWVRMMQVPYRWLYPAVLLFCAIGVYSLGNNPADVLITAVFGVLGYAFAKLDCDPAPLLLGFILGPLMEENFRRALVITQGDFAVFVTRPISASLLAAAVLLLITLLLPAIRRGRDLAFQE